MSAASSASVLPFPSSNDGPPSAYVINVPTVSTAGKRLLPTIKLSLSTCLNIPSVIALFFFFRGGGGGGRDGLAHLFLSNVDYAAPCK